MQQTFRPGSVGALMDEYERAALEMKHVLSQMTEAEYTADANAIIVGLESIKALTGHVLSSGYGYATYVSAAFGKPIERPNAPPAPYAEIASRLDDMLAFTDAVLKPHYTIPEEQLDTITMMAPWNIPYTLDQMLEHAVCHIHRHRRQMEKFLVAVRG